MTDLTNPVPIWLDGIGQLADDAKIYVGEAGSDPENPANQLALTFPGPAAATQPIRTRGGYTVNGGNRSPVRLPDGTTAYSIRVRDANNLVVYYIANQPVDTAAFQPSDADLTAIAALVTTPFGRNLLTLANAAALDAATGRPASLAAAGGAMTGDITRTSSGTYLFTSGGTVGKVIVLPTGDPTSTTDCAVVAYY